MTAQGSEQFPSEELTDWVSYADAVIVATVKSETQLPFSPDVTEHKEGYVGRTIEVAVDSVLWRPKTASAKLAENDIHEMLVFGWLLKEDRLIPMSSVNAPRLEVGGQYILPVVKYKLGWAPLTPGSATAISASSVAVKDARDRSAENKYTKELDGRSFSEISALLSTIPPDELAEEHNRLPPEERIQTVLRLRNPNPPEHPANMPAPPKP